jgi:hypothetical protein
MPEYAGIYRPNVGPNSTRKPARPTSLSQKVYPFSRDGRGVLICEPKVDDVNE